MANDRVSDKKDRRDEKECRNYCNCHTKGDENRDEELSYHCRFDFLLLEAAYDLPEVSVDVTTLRFLETS